MTVLLCSPLACRKNEATARRDDASSAAHVWRAETPVLNLAGARINVQGQALDTVPAVADRRLPALEQALNEIRVRIEGDSSSAADKRAGRFVIEDAKTAAPAFAVVHTAYLAGYREVAFSRKGPWLALSSAKPHRLEEPSVTFSVLVGEAGAKCGNSLGHVVELDELGPPASFSQCVELALKAPAQLGMELGEVEVSAQPSASFSSLRAFVARLHRQNLSPLVLRLPNELSVSLLE